MGGIWREKRTLKRLDWQLACPGILFMSIADQLSIKDLVNNV
jgi:hypothetical protein